MVTKKIKQYIIENFNFDLYEEIVVGFSGGRDSVCLLHILNEINKNYKFKLIAIHINHNIREDEAIRDEKFSEDFAKKYNIQFKKYSVDVIKYAKENKLSLEEAGRICRYKCLYDEIKNKKSILAIAQHKNDKVETIIFNILRGTGIRGLIGIEEKKDNIIRPLINFDRNDINEYIKENKLDYVEDSTNEDININRNYIRKILFDDFYKINTSFIDHIYNLSKEIEEIDKYIYNKSNSKYNEVLIGKSDNKILINNKKFVILPHFIKAYIIKNIFFDLVDTNKNINNIHIENIIKSSKSTKGMHLDLPYNITLDKKKNSLIFNKNIINISMSNKKNKGGENEYR